MSTFSREEVKAAVDRFEKANLEAERKRNWAGLADFYTDDAVYTYVGLAAGGAVEARGRDQIRKIVMSRDMEDYAGWTFPFDWIAIDGSRVITRWWNRAPGARADGSHLQCPGMSVLEYAGDGKFKSQFDLYDRLSVKAVAKESAALTKRAKKVEADDQRKQKKQAKKAKRAAKKAARLASAVSGDGANPAKQAKPAKPKKPSKKDRKKEKEKVAGA